MSETPVDRLRTLAAALRGRNTIAEDTADDLADGIEAYLEGEAELESALGLKPAPGGRQWRTEQAINERDRVLREAAALYWPDRPVAEQAREMAAALARYAATGWPRHRSLAACPERLHGTFSALAWHVLRARDFVLVERVLRRILAGLELGVLKASAEADRQPQAQRYGTNASPRTAHRYCASGRKGRVFQWRPRHREFLPPCVRIGFRRPLAANW